MIDYFEKQLDVMRHAIDSIDGEVFEQLLSQVTRALENGHRVIATGLGKNVPICEKFVGTMTSMGLDAVFLNANSAFHGDMGCIRDGDFLIILSKSGETQEPIMLVRELNSQGRHVDQWLITYSRASALGDLVPQQLVMDLEHEGDLWNVMPNNSTMINLFVLQGVAILVAQRMGIEFEQFARNHPGGAIGVAIRERERSCGLA